MLTRETFAQRFGRRAVFGMVHIKALPGAPMYGGSMAAVIDAAVRDARALSGGGCDGIGVENFGDRPFFATRVPPETIAAMTRVIAAVAAEARLPIGVNVLRNDARAALAIASAVDAAFIRVNVHHRRGDRRGRGPASAAVAARCSRREARRANRPRVQIRRRPVRSWMTSTMTASTSRA